MVHLKLNYLSDEDVVATVEVDLEVCMSFFLAVFKLHHEKADIKDKEQFLIKYMKGLEEVRRNGKVNTYTKEPQHAIFQLEDV